MRRLSSAGDEKKNSRNSTTEVAAKIQKPLITPTICFFPGRGKISTTRYGHIAIELTTHGIPYYFSYGESAKSVKDDEKKYGEVIRIPLPPQFEDIILTAINKLPKQFPPLGYNKFSNNCADAVLGFILLTQYKITAPVKVSNLKITEFQPVLQITDPELIAKLACDIRNRAILDEKVSMLNTEDPPLTRVILLFENEIKKLENDKLINKIISRNDASNAEMKKTENDIAQLSQLVIQLTEMKKTAAPHAAILSKLLDYGSQLSSQQFEICYAIVDLCGIGIETTRNRSTESVAGFEKVRERSGMQLEDKVENPSAIQINKKV